MTVQFQKLSVMICSLSFEMKNISGFAVYFIFISAPKASISSKKEGYDILAHATSVITVSPRAERPAIVKAIANR
jgi:hypothetical protein